MSEARTNILWLVILGLAFLIHPASAKVHSDNINHIFVLHSYGQQYPWTESQHQGFLSALDQTKASNFLVSTEHLDTKRLSYDAAYQEMFKGYLEHKYPDYQPDLVYVTDDNALDFATRFLIKQFPFAPVIFSGVNNLDAIRQLDLERFVGVYEHKEIQPNLNLLRILEPNLESVLIVGDASETHLAIKLEVTRELENQSSIKPVFIESNQLDELVRQLELHPEKYIVLTTVGGVRAKDGNALTLDQVLSEIVSAGNFIVISMEDAYLKTGILGGYVTDGYLQGESAGQLAVQYFSGQAIHELSNIISGTNRYIFDDRLLRKYQLSLPEEIKAQALLRHQPSSWYERNRAFITSALMALSILVFVILVLFAWTLSRKNRQISQHAREIENREKQELQRLKKVEVFQDALVELSKENAPDLDDAFAHATRISSETIGVKQVSVWLCTEGRKSIVCHSQYVMGEGFIEPGAELKRIDFPTYFNGMDTGRILAIDDVFSDPVTSELTDVYLAPNNITSMLDVPILYQGDCMGVVCHEHIGKPRRWTLDEQEFAYAVAKTVSLSLEISRRRDMEQKLEHHAYHDALTGLPNRELLADRLDQAILQASRNKDLVAVLFIDLDNFKHINDSLGHSMGDKILVEVSRLLTSQVREMDTVSRIGGDEFIMVMHPFMTVNQVTDVASMIYRSLQEPIITQGHELSATASIGVSIFPNDGDSSETLIKNADAAMYHAKSEGRNAFHFYTKEMTHKAMDRISLESSLRKAISNNEFVVFYQPQYDLIKKKLVGFEALVRWDHPEKGILSPFHFISVAEEVGLIVQIDRMVMESAMQQFKIWRDKGFDVGALNLNLSMRQLDQNDFYDEVENQLKINEFEACGLNFEVTESCIMTDPNLAIERLKQLGNLGIGIAIDDFGTGYSSLEYLKNLPVDKLKIDRSFVRDVVHDAGDATIIKAVIALASSLNLSVIAEGVEEQEQADFLLAHGCSEVQGYFYGKPMDVETIEQDMQKLIDLLK